MTVKNAKSAKVGDHSLSAKDFPQRLGIRVLGANFQWTPFLSIDAVGPDFFGQNKKGRSMVALTEVDLVTRRSARKKLYL